jgi:hypothetical protein
MATGIFLRNIHSSALLFISFEIMNQMIWIGLKSLMMDVLESIHDKARMATLAWNQKYWLSD